MKLWDKGFSTAQAVTDFTVGSDREMDARLAKYDIQGSKAHAIMLQQAGLLTADETTNLLAALDDLLIEVQRNIFFIPDEFEDIHSWVEYRLVQMLGEAGKRIHTARSRNDQVLVDVHLYLKDALLETANLVKSLFDLLLNLSQQYSHVAMPGYTHTQVAMPSSFGLWFGAYAEILADDLLQIKAAYDVANQNPLGSAAGYGSPFSINRQITTDELNFGQMRYNSLASQLSRGRTERSASWALASVASTLSKLSSDVCLFMCQNFGMVGFPDNLTTGSSIMPHKKNPDVFELVRARCNMLQNVPNQISLLIGNLTAGYHRDFQMLKECVFPAFDTLADCLQIVCFSLPHIQVNDVTQQPMYKYMFTVETLALLVSKGTPFRDAYRIIGEQVQNGTYTPDVQVPHTHQGSIGNLCNEQIREKFYTILNQLVK